MLSKSYFFMSNVLFIKKKVIHLHLNSKRNKQNDIEKNEICISYRRFARTGQGCLP